ncbi:MAG: hypothetical protein AAAC47_25405, partial [Pararhizobium sp.]
DGVPNITAPVRPALLGTVTAGYFPRGVAKGGHEQFIVSFTSSYIHHTLLNMLCFISFLSRL